MAYFIKILPPFPEPEPASILAGIIVFFIVVITFFGNPIGRFLSNWHEIGSPLGWIVGVFYYTIFLPLATTGDVWSWCFNPELTRSTVINYAVALIGVTLYVVFLTGIYAMLIMATLIARDEWAHGFESSKDVPRLIYLPYMFVGTLSIIIFQVIPGIAILLSMLQFVLWILSF